MASAEVAKLRDIAAHAIESGRLDQALRCFVELERLDPDPDWARRAAGVYKKLGRPGDEIEALARASRRYAERGDILKAVATSKQILAIDPRHPETLRRLPELRAAWDAVQTGSLPAPAPAADAPLEIERTSERKADRTSERAAPAPSLGPRAAAWSQKQDSGLMALPLRDVVPGAAVARRSSPSPGIYQIPLPDDVDADASIDLVLEEDVPNHLALGRGPNVALDAHGNVSSAPAVAAEDLAIAAVEEELRAAEKANAALSKVPLFSDLSKKTFGELLLHARLVELEAKKELFHQGDRGDALYVIAEGTVGVVDEGPPRRGIARLGEGAFVGEVALVIDQPRTATIVALTDCLLIAVDREVVHKVLATDAGFLTALLRFLRDRLVDKLLLTNPLFTSLSARDRDALKPRFRFLEVDPGALVLEEGRRPDGLVILLAGEAEVYRAQAGREVLLGALRAGDVCGETALLTGGVAFASVRARSKCLALELPEVAFQKIVGARPEALAFIKQVMEQRIAQSKAILSGKASYGEGRVRVL